MTTSWDKDTGLVFSLVFIILGLVRDSLWMLWVSATLLGAVLFIPGILRPLGLLWRAVAENMGFVMNNIFFGLVFLLIVVPMGYLKRIVAGDARDQYTQPLLPSAFHERIKKRVEAADLEQPF
jgi:hypothetical protein